MAKYSDHGYDEDPGTKYVHRMKHKFAGHKLARALGHNQVMRKQGGESAKKKR